MSIYQLAAYARYMAIVYELLFKDTTGKEISLNAFHDETLLILNTMISFTKKYKYVTIIKILPILVMLKFYS